MFWIAFAIAFLVVLFFIKNKSVFTNSTDSALNKQNEGLTYSSAIVGDLINKDTDGDGVLDWEESLWGTDSRKKDTTPGISDNLAIEKLKIAQGKIERGESSLNSAQSEEKLTETDKFSRELFSTIAALNQNGAMDQATADKISESLAERIQNSPPRKVYALSDLKISAKDDAKAVQDYSQALVNIQAKYPVKATVIDVLQKFIIDENNVDSSVLSELDPIIEQTRKIIDATVKMSVPQSIVSPHLDFLNALQRLVENTSDIKLYDTDVIISLGGISQYDQNTTALQSAIDNLLNTINKKLSN